MSDEVHVETADAVTVITLDRPKALNALNAAVAAGLGAALQAADDDEAVRAIVATGTGRASARAPTSRRSRRASRCSTPSTPSGASAGSPGTRSPPRRSPRSTGSRSAAASS